MFSEVHKGWRYDFNSVFSSIKFVLLRDNVCELQHLIRHTRTTYTMVPKFRGGATWKGGCAIAHPSHLVSKPNFSYFSQIFPFLSILHPLNVHPFITCPPNSQKLPPPLPKFWLLVWKYTCTECALNTKSTGDIYLESYYWGFNPIGFWGLKMLCLAKRWIGGPQGIWKSQTCPYLNFTIHQKRNNPICIIFSSPPSSVLIEKSIWNRWSRFHHEEDEDHKKYLYYLFLILLFSFINHDEDDDHSFIMMRMMIIKKTPNYDLLLLLLIHSNPSRNSSYGWENPSFSGSGNQKKSEKQFRPRVLYFPVVNNKYALEHQQFPTIFAFYGWIDKLSQP